MDTQEYKKFALEIARTAGMRIKENFSLGSKKEWKADNSPVTETDIYINKLVIEEIQKRFVGHGILGEEESSLNGTEEYVWVCDPIDGTVPFSHGIPISTFSLALTRNGESILGVVYDPFMDRMFFAEKGRGADMNDEPVHVSSADQLQSIAGDCSYPGGALHDTVALTVHLSRNEGAKLSKLYSVVYASMLVALGEFGFVIFTGHTAHDAAAVKIITEEAGGVVTDLFGDDQRYDRSTKGFIASNGKLHEQLVGFVKSMVTPV